MIHLGDITKISGYDAQVVDIITGGSPCQDLSVAGKRAGLAGERSGLFMEQIRIIKEMREKEIQSGKTNDSIRPRYMVWENVAGAFSSNKGEDFRAVLEETAKVADKDAVIPGLKGGQKWTPSGCIMGDGWSIAWRLHDAQFWGVSQRRKRIALVADFGGQTAPEILFERKGLSRDIETSGTERKGTSTEIERSLGATRGGMYDVRISSDGTKNWRAHCYETEICRALDTGGEDPNSNHGGVAILENVYCLQGNGIDRADTAGCNGKGWREKQSYTLNTIDRPAVCVVENHPADSRVKISKDGIFQTLSSRMGTGGGNVPMVMETYTSSKASYHQRFTNDGKAETLVASDYKDPPTITYGLDRASFNQGENAKFDFSIDEEKTGPQVARGPGAVFQSVVRRLTPLECERLQGFPDYWTDIGDWVDSKGKKHKGDSDAPRYKALGNSIALPFWEWMADRMVKYLDIEHATFQHHPTMASLFDGIGGFPLVFSWVGCEPVWASEIEEFPIAVTKKWFPE